MNFRNFQECQAHLGMRLNAFIGDNAQGKTNLLEALFLLATGRSFRTQQLKELIRCGEEYFFLEASFFRDGVRQTATLSFDGKEKRLQLGSMRYHNFTPLLGLMPCVLYTPQDAELVSGSPNERRRFMNMHLAQSDPLYVHHLTRFTRAMKQRNCLLKEKILSTIELFEEQMAISAAYLWQARKNMLEEIQEPLLKAAHLLSRGKETHTLRLQAKPENYKRALEKSRAKELSLGFTLHGPHRDDLIFFINEKEALQYGSEGQKKTAIAALKIAEWQRLSEKISEPALFGVDDLGIHLDSARVNLFQELFLQMSQVFLTTPNLQAKNANTLRIQEGQIRLSQGERDLFSLEKI